VPYNPAFDIKLKEGEAREGAFQRILRGDETVEVKSDVMSRVTGNVFIEFAQHGTKSGIATTTADYWAIETLPDRWIFIKTEELQKVAGRVWLRQAKRTGNKNYGVPGGDNKSVRGVLVPIAALFESLQ
jgi:hypothetical protein